MVLNIVHVNFRVEVIADAVIFKNYHLRWTLYSQIMKINIGNKIYEIISGPCSVNENMYYLLNELSTQTWQSLFFIRKEGMFNYI